MAEPPIIVDFKTFDRRSVTIVDGIPYVTLPVQPRVNRGVISDCERFAPGCGIGHGSLPQGFSARSICAVTKNSLRC